MTPYTPLATSPACILHATQPCKALPPTQPGIACGYAAHNGGH
jgi:hypothetical protein